MVEEGKSTVSAPLILIVEFLVALILAVGLLHKYGDLRRQNVFVTISTLVVWFLSFVIIFLLPVDVSSVSPAMDGTPSRNLYWRPQLVEKQTVPS